MSENKLPFIPAWLDNAGLSPAEFRIYCHLRRCADNSTGIAWPAYKAMTNTCGTGKTTVRRCLEELERREMIAKAGKPFGGSCRYRVLAPIVPPQGQMDVANSSTTGTIETAPIVPPQDCNSPSSGTPIVPPQGQMDVANSSTTGTIETAPIVPPQDCNSPSSGTPIVPPQGQEGKPKKVNQKKVNQKREASLEAKQFATWFKSSLPSDANLKTNWHQTFTESYDDLVTLDKRTDEEIREVCLWARTDSFWQGNFHSPAKLRKRNKDGITYFDLFRQKMKQPQAKAYQQQTRTLIAPTRLGTEEQL